MRKKITSIVAAAFICFAFTSRINGQVAINDDGSQADASAALHVQSTSKGMLFPRMTTAQMNDISSPQAGLIVYNIDDHQFYVFESSSRSIWDPLPSGPLPGTEPFACGDWLYFGTQFYSTIEINDQCWMEQNLNIGTYVTGAPSDNGTIEKHCYNDVADSCNIYGGLYQWDELMQYQDNEGGQGICPDGWHIPTAQEFIDLVNFYGGQSNAGNELKEDELRRWDPGLSGNNASGFSAIGGAKRPDSDDELKKYGYYWTSTESDASNSKSYRFSFDNFDVLSNIEAKSVSFSVRCIKD